MILSSPSRAPRRAGASERPKMTAKTPRSATCCTYRGVSAALVTSVLLAASTVTSFELHSRWRPHRSILPHRGILTLDWRHAAKEGAPLHHSSKLTRG